MRTISAAIHAATLVVVLATRTYGSPGTDSFATAEGNTLIVRVLHAEVYNHWLCH